MRQLDGGILGYFEEVGANIGTAIVSFLIEGLP